MLSYEKGESLVSRTFIVLLITGWLWSVPSCAEEYDPYERLNRQIFTFNMRMDKVVTRPLARVYDRCLPTFVKCGVSNFFSNLGTVTTVANDLLQFRVKYAISDTARLVINTLVGVGGVWDVATKLGLEKRKNDFGLTLTTWGAKESPYLVLPFLGPATMRDAVGLPLDYYFFSVWPYIQDETLRYGLRGGNLLQQRADLLGGDDLIEQAFDPYILVRDAYLQRRAYLTEGMVDAQ